MGEAKNNINGPWRWHRIGGEPLPRNEVGLVVQVRLTCSCAPGGLVALPAGRLDGEWVIGDFEHQFEIEAWMKLPPFLPRLSS